MPEVATRIFHSAGKEVTLQIFSFYQLILPCLRVKATVGDLFRSPTVGDLTFIFFICKIDFSHWMYLNFFKDYSIIVLSQHYILFTLCSIITPPPCLCLLAHHHTNSNLSNVIFRQEIQPINTIN